MTRVLCKWVHFWISILFIHTLSLSVAAQEVSENKINAIWVNVNSSIGIPQQAFRDRMDAVGIGFGNNILVTLPSSPLLAGIDISYTGYQRAKLDLEIDVGGFFESFDLITRNNIVQMYGLLRFEPPLHFFLQPYLDGLIGAKLLYTHTRLINRDNAEEGVVERTTNQQDWAFSYGGAVGLKVHLLEYPGIALDLRCAYLLGTNATFMVKRTDADQLILENTIDAFEEKHAPTHLLLPQIGVSINLLTLE